MSTFPDSFAFGTTPAQQAVKLDRTSVGARSLEVDVCEQGTTTTITVYGAWDLTARLTGEGMRSVLKRSPECVVLDLSQLTFIDSAGIHTVMELDRRSIEENFHLVIIPGSRAVHRPFEILGLTDVLPFLNLTA